MFRFYKLYSLYLNKMSPMEWCLCEKLPRAVLHIPLTADKKCDLCGLPRRPRSGNSSSSDEEGERRQRMLAERRRAEEACKGKVRVKVAMSAKKPKPSKTCGKCGGTQKLATCQVNESNVNHKVYAGRFGHYKKPKRLPMGSMAGQTSRGEAGGAEPNGLLQEKPQQQEELPPRRSIPNTRTHESLWEPTSDMPRLVAMAHEVFNRPMHMRQRYYSSLFVSDFIPLTKPITDRTCGAISKRRTGGRAFMEHRSRPLPPLSKVLADMRESREREEELEANMRASGGGLAQPTTSIPSSAYSTQFLPFNSYEGPSEDALVVQSARSLLSRPNSLHITPRTDLPCTRLPTFESESSSNCSSPSKGMQSAEQSEIFCPTQQFYFMRNSAPLNDELLKAANHARASTSSSSSSSESSPQLRTAPRCSSSTLLMKQCALSTAKKPLISLRVRGGQCATTSNIYLSSDDAEAMHKKWQFPEPKANPSKSNSLLGKLDSIWMLNKSNSYSKTGEDNGKKNHVRFADDPVFIFPHEPDSLEPQKPLKSISLLTNKFISHTDLETEQQRCLNLMHTDSLKRDSSVVRRDLNHLLESLNLNDRYEVEDSNLQTQVTLLEDEPSDLATPDDSKGLEHLMSRLNIKGCTDTVNSSMEMSTENEVSNHHTPSVGQTNLEQMFSDLRIADCNKTEDSSMETEVTPLRADDGHDFEIKEQPDGVGHYVVLSEISNDLPVNLTNKLNDDECYPKGLSPGKQECRIHKLAMEKLVRKPNGKLSKQLSPSMWSQFVDLFTPRKRTSCNRCGMKKSKENSTLSTKICPIVPKRNQCTSIELSDARTVAPKTSLYSLKIATARTNIRTPPPKKIKIAAEPADSNETSTNESYRTCPDSVAMPQKDAEKAYPEKYSFTKVKMNRYPTTATVKPRTVKPPKPLKKRKSLKEMKTKPLETQTWHFVKIIETVHHKCTEIFFPKMLAFVRDIISTTATATWQYKEYISGESTLDFYEFRAPDVWLNDIKVDEAENDLKNRARQLGRYLLKQQQNRQMEQTGFENELFETWMSADKRRATMVDKETQLGSDCSSTYQVPGKRTKQDQSKCRSRKKSKPEAPVWPAHPFRHKKRRVTKVASSVGSYASDEDDDKDTFESSRVQSIPDYKLPDSFKKPLQLITTDVRLSMTKTLQSVNNKGIHGLEPAEYTRQEDSFDDNRLSATPDSISDPESPNTFKKPLQLISTNVRTFKISKKILEPIQYTPQEDNYSLLQQQLKESMLKPIHLITSIGVTVPKSARPAETIRPTIKAFQSDGSKTHLLSEIIPAPETMNGQRFQQNLQTSSWQMIALEATSERFENNINSCQHACPVHNCTALLGPDTFSTHFIQMHRYKGTSLQESYHRVLQGYPRQFTFDSQHLTEENSFIALLIYSRVTNGGEQSSSLHDQPYVLIGAFGEFPNLSLNQECSLAMVFWLVGYTTPVPLNATLTVHSPCNGVGRSRNILPIGVNATQDPRRFVKGSKDYFLLRTSTKNHGLLQISIVMKEQSEASELLGH
ncbi:uncharacterized protein LOC115626068 [Scaptodrosophila lebanonensis]|uniref:Uncharacterized protein LOC115626068 n=1 Tax=Drosophila lebanonensis TaxID=7225 RepID=A0A6J2TKN4_DROLE|nr:uncharacterized protein LOC115626068 [Scaptodrosophila lebanonensis]